LPFPGRRVSGGMKLKPGMKVYDGNWAEMDEDFRIELKSLIEGMLSDENLVIKKVDGVEVSAMEYSTHVESFFDLFTSSEIPEPKTVYESTIENRMTILINECITTYKTVVYQNFQNIKSDHEIPVLSGYCKMIALEKFDRSKKMGNSNSFQKYKDILEEKIDELYNEFESKSEENIKKCEREKQLIEEALETRLKLEIELKSNERKALEAVIELDNLKHSNNLETQRFKEQQELANKRLHAEIERMKQMEKNLKYEQNINYRLTEMLNELELQVKVLREHNEQINTKRQCIIM
jgi:hypothetical protein